MTSVKEIAEFLDERLDRHNMNNYRHRPDLMALVVRELISEGYIGTRTLWGVQVYAGTRWVNHGVFFVLRSQAENERRRILARKWYRSHEVRLVTVRTPDPQRVDEAHS